MKPIPVVYIIIMMASNFYKDGINDHIVHGADTINPKKTGTKAAVNYDITVPAKQSVTLRLRLTQDAKNNFDDFDADL